MRRSRECGLHKPCWLLGTVLLVFSLVSHAQEPVSITPPQANGWWSVSLAGGNLLSAYRIEASTNLIDWQEIAKIHGVPFTFYDPRSAQARSRFYRAWAAPLTPDDDWRNQAGAQDSM